jgi:hypothetical protein
MMRRPDRLAGMRISLGRRLNEPESFVSSSCVGELVFEAFAATGFRGGRGLDAASIL